MKDMKNAGPFDFLKHLQQQSADYKELPFVIADRESLNTGGMTTPFKTYFYTIGLFYENKGRIKAGKKEYNISKGSLLTIGPGTTCQWIDEGYPLNDTLFFYEDIFLNSFSSTFFYSLQFFCPDAHNTMQFEGAELEEMQYLFGALRLFRSKPDVLPGILFSILKLAQKKYWRQFCHNKKELTSKERTAAQFRSLVAKNFALHKDVSFYADALHITPKYLSELLMEVTGMTAKKWIEHHLMQEAKYLMAHGGLSVKETSFALGYADTSYFVKAFKKHEGQLPGDFKKDNMHSLLK